MKKIFSLAILFMAFACREPKERADLNIWQVAYQNNSSVDVALTAYLGTNVYKYDIATGESKEFVFHDHGYFPEERDDHSAFFVGYLPCDSVQIVFAEERVQTYTYVTFLKLIGTFSSKTQDVWSVNFATVEITPEMYESAVPIAK